MSHDKVGEKKAFGPSHMNQGVRISDRGIFSVLRELLLKVKGKVAKEGETVEIEDMIKIGGQRPQFPEPVPPKPKNEAAMRAKAILSKRRDELCHLAVEQYENEMDAYRTAIEVRADQRRAHLEANPDADEDQIDLALGPPPDEPMLEFPNAEVPDVTPEYDLADKSKYELKLKDNADRVKKLQKDEVMAIALIKNGCQKSYMTEFEQIHGYKEIAESKNVTRYIDLLVTFHLCTKPGRPQEALDDLTRYFENMSQKRDEYLTRWKERIEDQAHAIRIVQQYERDMRARKDGKSEEEISNLPPVETKSEEVLVRKFINRMDSRFSMFSELYTRGERAEYPATLLDAHKEAERYGANDLRPHKNTSDHDSSRVYTAKVSEQCNFCSGRYHTEKDCKFKKNGMTSEEAKKYIQEKKNKSKSTAKGGKSPGKQRN